MQLLSFQRMTLGALSLGPVSSHEVYDKTDAPLLLGPATGAAPAATDCCLFLVTIALVFTVILTYATAKSQRPLNARVATRAHVALKLVPKGAPVKLEALVLLWSMSRND